MLKELDATPERQDARPGLGPPAGGRSRGFERFVFEHQESVYNVAYRILGDQDLAVRATRDTLARSFATPAGLCAAAATQVLMQLVSSICAGTLPGASAAGTHRSANGDSFQACLATLPLDERIAVVLSDVRGLSYREIAEITRAPLGAVRSRLSQGRAALRDKLLSEGEIGP